MEENLQSVFIQRRSKTIDKLISEVSISSLGKKFSLEDSIKSAKTQDYYDNIMKKAKTTRDYLNSKRVKKYSTAGISGK